MRFRAAFPRFAAVLILAGCALGDAQVDRPRALAGTWVRLGNSGAPDSDTVTYLADGRLRGSRTRPLSPNAQWSVIRSKIVGEGLCLDDGSRPKCQAFRLEGDTLLIGDGPVPAAYFRRIR